MKHGLSKRLQGTGRIQSGEAAGGRKPRWRRGARLRLEGLEERVLLNSTMPLPVPVVTGQTAIAPAGTDTQNTPSISVDPLNPNDVVAVYSEHDVLSPVQPNSFLDGRFSTDGGKSWSQTSIFGAPVFPDNQIITDANVGFDRSHHFFVSWLDRQADHSAGTLRVERFAFTASGPVSDVPSQRVYQWVGGSDQIINPYLVVDTNPPQTDLYSNNVYIAWNSHNTPPSNVPPNTPFNPDFIYVVGSSDSGLTWSSATSIQPNTDIFTFERDATPRLAVTSSGQLSVVWTDWGSLSLPPNLTPPLQSQLGNAVVNGAGTGVFTNPGGPITDATAAGTVPIPFNGQGNLAIPSNGNVTDSSLFVPANTFTSMTGLVLNVSISYPADGATRGDGDLQLQLIDPSGASTDVAINDGGFVVGNFNNTTFADNPGAPRISDNTQWTGPTAFDNRVFQPVEPLFTGQPKRANSTPNGTWHLRVTDTGIGSGTLVSWSLTISGNTPQTPQVTAFPIQVNITDPKFRTASDLDVNMFMSGVNLSGQKIVLAPPVGSGLLPITLVNNTNNANGTSNPGQGINGSQLGGTNLASGTIFDDEAIRSIRDTGAGTFVGRFQPEYGDPTTGGTLGEIHGLSPAQLNGTWTLFVTDFVNNGAAGGGTLGGARLEFTSGLDVAVPAQFIGTVNLVGGESPGTYLFKPSVEPVVGIGPDVNIAVDNTQGSASPYAGRMYMVYVDRVFDITGTLPLDDTNIELRTSDDGGHTWSAPRRVNDDNSLDGFSGGDRPQLEPQVAVDPFTGALVISFYDARYDASRVRTANTLAVSYDGGQTFAKQVFVNPVDTVTDAITGQNAAAIRPLPDNDSGNNPTSDKLFGFGDRQGLAVANGHVYNAWIGNQNAGPDSDARAMIRPYVWVSQTLIMAGPRIIASTMGPVHGITLDGQTFNQNTLPDGRPVFEKFAVQFDRPVDPNTFGPDDVQVFFQAAAGGGFTPIPVASVRPLDNGPRGGALTFLVTLQTPQTATGTYSYLIGPFINGVVGSPLDGGPGNVMDQNSDGTAGEVATATSGGDVYSAPLPAKNGPVLAAPFNQDTLPLIIPGPHVVGTHVPGAGATPDNLVMNAPVSAIDVTFDRDMQPGTFTSSAILRMVGPGGVPITGPFTITPNPNGNDPDPNFPRTYRITFPAQQISGEYTLTLAPVIRAKNGDLLDQNQNAGVDVLLDKPSGGSQDQTFSNPGSTPINFGNNVSTITIADSFVIQNVVLNLDITDPDDRDLTATLTAPDGTQVRLFTNIGSSVPPQGNFSNTVLDDAASTPQGDPNPITGPTARPPYNGTFNPQTPLSVLKGKPSVGTWTLTINNNNVSHHGTLNRWSLVLGKPVPLSGLGDPVGDQAPISFRIFSPAASTQVSANSWSPVGPAPIVNSNNSDTYSDRIGAIVPDPSDPTGNTVYIGAAGGGVWKTSNFLTTDPQGPTYVPLTDLGPAFSLNIGSMAVFGRNNDPAQSVVVAATGNGDGANIGDSTANGIGFLLSTNGGQSWSVLDSTDNTLPMAQRDHIFDGSHAFKVAVDPHPTPSGDVIIFAALSGPDKSAGIWRSVDTGKHWTRVRAGQATDVILQTTDVDATSGAVRLVYAAFPAEGIFVSSDSGIGWTLMAGATGDPLIIQRDKGNGIPVAVTAGPAPNNGTKGRITLAVPFPTGNRAQDLGYQGWVYALVSGNDGNLDGVYLTKDFGQNWTQVKIPTFNYKAPFFDEFSWRTTNSDTNANYNIFGQNGGAVGNFAQSIAIDPLNPNVVYVGGGGDLDPNNETIRIDTTMLQDPHDLYAFNNFRNDGGRVESGTVGGSGRTNTSVFQGGLGPDYGLITGGVPFQHYLNLLRDPNNPFLSDATLSVLNTPTFNNDGVVASWMPMDDAADGTHNYHRMWSMLDPLTGHTRLIFGTQEGVFSRVVNSDGSFDDGVSTGPISGGGVVSPGGSRNGNLQITQFTSGAAQPSQLAADIAGAMFYGAAGFNGAPTGGQNVLSDGNLTWHDQTMVPEAKVPFLDFPVPGTFRTFFGFEPGTGVATDSVGSGTSYYYFDPSANTNFFQVGAAANAGGGGVGRTFGLLQTSKAATNPDPQWTPEFRVNFAVNPVDGSEMIVSSNAGRVFRTHNQGLTWFPIAEPTVLDGTPALALAYGAPQPSDPTGQLDNFIYAGTQGAGGTTPAPGHIFVTFDGGGHWTNISNGLDGSSVEAIIADPNRGMFDAYAVTSSGVFYLPDARAANASWQNISGNLFKINRTPFGDPSLQETALKFLDTMAVDWRFTIPDDPTRPGGPTHPALYVGGMGGVFRSTDRGKTWTIFPNIATDGAARDGGYLPNVVVTHLDLALGNFNPTTGRPDPNSSLDLLLATTAGRGSFAIRVPKPAAQTSLPTDQTLAAVDVPGGQVVFSVAPDHSLWRHDDKTGWVKIGGTGTIESVTAAADASGNVVAFAMGTDRALFEYNRGAWTQLGAAGTIQAISAGTDPAGNPLVFVVTATNALAEFRLTSGWRLIGASHTVLAISATKNGTVVVVTATNSVAAFSDQVGWTALAGNGFAIQVSAVIDSHGQLVVDAITTDHALYEHRDPTGWLKWGGSGTIQAISAGTDAAGNANVFAITANNGLSELDLPAGWRTIGGPGTIRKISAVSADRVFAVTATQAIFGEDSHFGWFAYSGPGFAQS